MDTCVRVYSHVRPNFYPNPDQPFHTWTISLLIEIRHGVKTIRVLKQKATRWVASQVNRWTGRGIDKKKKKTEKDLFRVERTRLEKEPLGVSNFRSLGVEMEFLFCNEPPEVSQSFSNALSGPFVFAFSTMHHVTSLRSMFPAEECVCPIKCYRISRAAVYVHTTRGW